MAIEKALGRGTTRWSLLSLGMLLQIAVKGCYNYCENTQNKLTPKKRKEVINDYLCYMSIREATCKIYNFFSHRVQIFI
jgi:hypothetical protein